MSSFMWNNTDFQSFVLLYSYSHKNVEVYLTFVFYHCYHSTFDEVTVCSFSLKNSAVFPSQVNGYVCSVVAVE